MSTTTMNKSNIANQPLEAAEKESVWPKGSIPTLFGLTAAMIIGSGIVFLGIAELVMALA